MKKIRWGILSTAKIGVQKVIPAIQKSRYCEVRAIGSRTLKKARAAAKTLGIPKAFGSYDEIINDPEIEAVYNPLPNHLHVPWCMKALDAGKHVLCEKPISLDAVQARELLDYSQKYPGLKIMEAFVYRHHPQWQKIPQLVAGGKIGTLKTITSFFSYPKLDSSNYRNYPEMGGGGLMDIGCYCISVSRFMFGREPERVFGIAEPDPEFGVDGMTSAILDFGCGTATFTSATQLSLYQSLDLYGTEGCISIPAPFGAPLDQPCRFFLHRKQRSKEIVIGACNQFTIQAELFARAILEDKDVFTPLSDGVANMKVIDAVFRSSETGTWQTM
ncbi:Gfo/Idh/MocA family protein [Fibrobacterota bacterium]